ncbi:hypothetical protein QJS10_CPB04g00598 [Acorus calamus]|uniref:Uncharacterized protein n=1 Tax=Acorus calamus TaxID=4465 RepID=A0AAV9F159_ACOCL|nr:hypothetical protein QJS10_CPB04g00598 [Acorus calamus]
MGVGVSNPEGSRKQNGKNSPGASGASLASSCLRIGFAPLAFVTTRATAELWRLVEHTEYAMMLHLLSSLISIGEQEPLRIGGGDGGGAVEAANDGAEMTGLQWPSKMT